jgi:predicted nucleic acid-binding protein
MSCKAFLDTNLFVYAYDRRDAVKQSIALNLIRDLTESDEGVISYHVAQEFFNVVLRQSKIAMPIADAQILLQDVFRPLLKVPSTVALVSNALEIERRYLLSWYDSLIVAAAQQAGCSVLYSEDLQHGQRFGNLVVRNPFL